MTMVSQSVNEPSAVPGPVELVKFGSQFEGSPPQERVPAEGTGKLISSSSSACGVLPMVGFRKVGRTICQVGSRLR
jgi:hypothetical protein